MLSIVVYGRNDNHGYNLHKRAAVNINCLAEMLRDPADELIFVFDAGLVGKDGLTAHLAAHTGLIADGGFDPRLSRATADRAWPQDGPRPDDLAPGQHRPDPSSVVNHAPVFLFAQVR